MKPATAAALLAVGLLAGTAVGAEEPCRPRMYIGLLGPSASLGYFAAVHQGPTIAGLGARLADFRRFTERGWLCGVSLFDLGFSESGLRNAFVAVRVGRLVHSAPRVFSYVALAAELMPGLALEYVLVPRAPWPVEFEVRVGACYGTRYSSLPEFLPELQWQASLGLRAGLGWWWMRGSGTARSISGRRTANFSANGGPTGAGACRAFDRRPARLPGFLAARPGRGRR